MSDWGNDPVTKPPSISDAAGWGHDPIVTAPGVAAGDKPPSFLGSIADEAHSAAQDYRQGVATAGQEMGAEFTDPAHFPEHWAKAGGAALQAGGAALGYAASPLMGPLKGSLQSLGLSKKDAAKVGDTLSMAIPLAGEANEARLVAKAAKEAGVGIKTMQGVLENARKASLATEAKPALDGSKKSAAQRLILQGNLDNKGAAPAMKAEAAERRATGAGEPVLLDVLPKKAQQVVRKAGEQKGPAGDILQAHQDAIEKGLSGKATARTEEMAPYKASIDQRKAALDKERSQRAETQYKEPYTQPIQADEHLFSILNEKSGTSAIARALSTAKERALLHPESAQQAKELQELRDYSTKRAQYEHDLKEWEAGEKGEFATPPNKQALDYINHPDTAEGVKETIRKAHGWVEKPKPEAPELPTVSGGTLDRIRIAMRDSGAGMKEHPKSRAEGVAVEERSKALGSYLDEVPHLKEARGDYRDYSQRINQLDFDRDLSTLRPKEFEDHLKGLSPEQKKELTHSVVERLAAQVGKSRSGAEGKETVLTTGHNAQENLRALLGKDTADKYIRAMELMSKSAEKAKHAASGGGSAGMDVAQDVAATSAKVGLSAVIGRQHHALWEVMRFIDRRLGKISSEEEARQIAEWATQQKDVEKTLQEIADAADPVKRRSVKLPTDILSKIPVGAAAGVAGAADAIPQPDESTENQ